MEEYAIPLIVFGSVISMALILGWLCQKGHKTGTQLPTVSKSKGTKDGGLVVLAGAGAAIATTTAVTNVSSGGCGDGGGGCGGGGCGGCGGCGS